MIPSWQKLNIQSMKGHIFQMKSTVLLYQNIEKKIILIIIASAKSVRVVVVYETNLL